MKSKEANPEKGSNNDQVGKFSAIGVKLQKEQRCCSQSKESRDFNHGRMSIKRGKNYELTNDEP